MKLTRIVRFSPPIVALSALLLYSPPSRAEEKTAALYRQKCAACHGADGKGQTPAGKSLGVRSFLSPEVVKSSDADLAGVIEKGKDKMPAYGKSMKPEEIRAMVVYLRTLAK
jgi:mono/diheme cytochrome c family protein